MKTFASTFRKPESPLTTKRPPSPFCLLTSAFCLLTSAFFFLPSAFVRGGLPQPMCIFYGQALDGYGWPYMDNATVILQKGTNEIAHCEIDGSMSPGVNFALRAYIDDGSDADGYCPQAVYPGDIVSIVVDDANGRKTIIESNAVPAVGQPGDILMVNVTAGVDSDGDGLPDEWEWELIDSGVNPAISNVTQITGSGDYDGDGQSDGDEYGAGTFAFLDYDYFFAEHMSMTPNGRMHLEFLSVPGKVYWVESTTNLPAGLWDPCAYSETQTGGLTYGPTEGDGDWLSLFVPLDDPGEIFRLMVR